jgi:hypothetical protein
MIPSVHFRNKEKAPSVISVISCSNGEGGNSRANDYRNLLHSVICVLSWVLPPITERDAWNASDSVRRPFILAQEQERTEKTEKKRTQKQVHCIPCCLCCLLLDSSSEHGESGFPISDFAQIGQ